MKTFYIVAFILLYGFSQPIEYMDSHDLPQQVGLNGISLLDLRSDQIQVRVTGTGQTTGHIADLHLRNLTDEDILIHVPPVFIPATGKYQPYIAPIPGSVTVPGGTTGTPAPEIVFPIDGYCVDVNRPPVPFGTPVTPIDKWINPRMNNFDQDGFNPEIPPIPPFVFPDGEEIIPPIRPWSPDDDFFDPPGGETVEVDLPPSIIVPTNPLPLDFQDEIFDDPGTTPPGGFHREVPVVRVDPEIQPELFTDLIFDAVTKITQIVDDLMDDGNLITPMTGREDFRESTIQQTFWIYTSNLMGTPYEFDDFKDNLIDQFSEVTGMDIEEAPESMKEEFESGAVSIWDSFKFVGEQAKVLKEFTPHREEMEGTFGGHSVDDVKAHTDSGADEATESLGAEAYAKGDNVKFKDGPDLHEAAHEAAHVVDGKAAAAEEPGVKPPAVFEPAEPPCACGDYIISPGKIVNKSTGEEITQDSISTLMVDRVVYHPPQIQLDCPDHCRYNEYFSNRIYTRNYHGYGGGTSSSSRSVESLVKGRSIKDFESSVYAYCEGELCVNDKVERTIYFTEENDCCDRIRSRNNGNLSFRAGGRRVVLTGNSLIVIPNNRNERSRTFNFPDNIEAIFCNLGSDQVFGLTQSEMESSSSGERYRRSNLTMSELPERDNELVHMEIDSPYRDEILSQMPRTFPASYVLSFQQSQNGDEFSFSMTIDKKTCRTMIQIFHNGQLIETIDGEVQN